MKDLKLQLTVEYAIEDDESADHGEPHSHTQQEQWKAEDKKWLH